MIRVLPRAHAVLDHFGDVLELYQFMLRKQQAIRARQGPGGPADALLKQMTLAQGVLTNRKRDLEASLKDGEADRFIHELWAVSGDISHLEFDLSHLPGAREFDTASQELAMEALVLTRDLTDPAHKAAFVDELRAQGR